MTLSNQVHVVDQDTRRRAQIACELAGSPLRAEVYESLDELKEFNPAAGYVLLSAEAGGHALQELNDYFRTRGEFLPVAVYSSSVNTRQIVDSIQNGAADFLAWPFDAWDVLGSLDRSARRAQKAIAEDSKRAAACLRIADLSAREREVLASMVEGRSNKETAKLLGISSRTVEIHRGNTIRKLAARSTAEAVRIGIYAGVGEA
jgi:FixJ family two-component response regulator